MPETDEFWDFYWDTRLSAIETLGKRAAILAASRVIRCLTGQLGRPLRLFELGCGEGQIIGPLLDAHESTGVEFQPALAEAYTQRVGRTGRMTRLGTAFSLVTQEDLPMLRTIERTLGHSLERRQV